jgi:hypothetical protein
VMLLSSRFLVSFVAMCFCFCFCWYEMPATTIYRSVSYLHQHISVNIIIFMNKLTPNNSKLTYLCFLQARIIVLLWDCWSTVKLSLTLSDGEGRLVNYYNISVPSYFPRGKAISRVVVVVVVSFLWSLQGFLWSIQGFLWRIDTPFQPIRSLYLLQVGSKDGYSEK